MPADATTFTLAFLAVFGGLALYLVRLELLARRLERRLSVLERQAPAGADVARGDGADLQPRSSDRP